MFQIKADKVNVLLINSYKFLSKTHIQKHVEYVSWQHTAHFNHSFYFYTYILSSCLSSWNAPLSITLIWLFSRCLWGKKRTSLSNQLQRFGFIWHWSASPSDWNDSWKRTRGPRDFALSQQWLISKQPFSHENQNRLLSDFMKCAVASADPRSCPACLWRRSGGYFQSSPLLWRLCHISGPLKFSRCFTKTAHLHGYFLFIFESLWIRTTRRHTHRARTATKLYSAPDNTSNPPKRETIPKQKTS